MKVSNIIKYGTALSVKTKDIISKILKTQYNKLNIMRAVLELDELH